MKNKQQLENKDRKVRVISFRLSERDYERHLSMAKLCYENGLTKGPDIVSYIRLSMECLWQYIISQVQAERSAEEKKEENRQQPQKKQEGGGEQQQDVVDYHTMTASSSSSRAAATATTNTAAMGGEQHTTESITRTPPLSQPPPTPPLFNNLHEYFQPVFDQLDKLNKMLDSFIEEENDKAREKKK
jgi:hypothetical protein